MPDAYTLSFTGLNLNSTPSSDLVLNTSSTATYGLWCKFVHIPEWCTYIRADLTISSWSGTDPYISFGIYPADPIQNDASTARIANNLVFVDHPYPFVSSGSNVGWATVGATGIADDNIPPTIRDNKVFSGEKGLFTIEGIRGGAVNETYTGFFSLKFLKIGGKK